MSAELQPLGRRTPTDWAHVESYPLRALARRQQPLRSPVVIGVNWYEAFDRPVQGEDRVWRIPAGDLGRVRGGHCVCLRPNRTVDAGTWYDFYDQGNEGACVGFGSSRAMSLLNRKRYDGRWLYHQAQKIDEWPGEDYDGTSVRAGMEVLRSQGHRPVYRGQTSPATLAADGISAYRWATSVEEVVQLLGYEGGDEVPLLNSWGRSYPHTTWMPLSVLGRLLREDGEFAVPTDR